MATAGELAYDSALKLIAAQEATLDNLRARAATLLTANAIIAAFLGATSVNQDAFGHPAAWIATSGFVGAAILVGVVVAPWLSWDFALTPSEVRSICGVDGPVSGDGYRLLADKIEADYRVNQVKLHGLMWAFIAASALVLLQAVGWIIALAVAA